MFDLMLETVCTKRKRIRIAGDDYPAELVKAKFMKLNSSHIGFVLDCMRENTTKIRNIKQYLKAVLFNAPYTIGSYYTALVTHDMYGGTEKAAGRAYPDYIHSTRAKACKHHNHKRRILLWHRKQEHWFLTNRPTATTFALT